MGLHQKFTSQSNDFHHGVPAIEERDWQCGRRDLSSHHLRRETTGSEGKNDGDTVVLDPSNDDLMTDFSVVVIVKDGDKEVTMNDRSAKEGV